ncbi:MAG: transposase, partial [Gammaproteobacteria bacterium]|nr:transposase [Gammaproteobacteria bacterium]
VLREIDSGKGISQVARQYQVHPNMVHRWRQQLRRHGEKAFPGNGKAHTEEAKIASLERKVGQLTMENDLLKKVLHQLEERPLSVRDNGDRP